MSNYPLGAENDPTAPYNQEDISRKEIEVDVKITLTKRLKLMVYEDEEDLENEVLGQCILPQDGCKYIATNTRIGRCAYKNLSNWGVEDFEVNEIK